MRKWTDEVREVGSAMWNLAVVAITSGVVIGIWVAALVYATLRAHGA